MQKKKHIFVTGGSGNIGSRTIKELLKDKSIRLYLLIYAKSKTEAIKEVEKSLNFWDISNKDQKRIRIFLGDITKENLGLNKSDYTLLSKKITHIIHFAANLKFIMPIEEAQLSILQGTKNVTCLAKSCQKNKNFIRFNHLSTMEVAGNMPGKIPENFIKTKRKFLNTYEIAKAEAEEFLEDEIKKGLPITIYRPSMVVGDSKTGKTLKFQTFYHLINDIVISPKYPFTPAKTKFRFDTIPVDFLAKTISYIYDKKESKNRIYNLVSGTKKNMGFIEFINFAKNTYEKLTKIKQKQIRFINPRIPQILMHISLPFLFGKAKRKMKAQIIFTKFLFLEQDFENKELKKILRKRNIKIPSINNYLKILLIYYIKHKDDKI